MSYDVLSQWSPGNNYGPVLSQSEIFRRNLVLDIHPILQGKHTRFTLLFNLSIGRIAGFTPEDKDRDVVFAQRDEPATLPRIEVMYILAEIAPWCTVIKNDKGITMKNIVDGLWKDYSEHYVTDSEFEMLPARMREEVIRTGQKRMAAKPSASTSGGAGAAGSSAAATAGAATAAPPKGSTPFKRYDWLRGRAFFVSLRRDDRYAEARLGFKAPNIFVMSLTA